MTPVFYYRWRVIDAILVCISFCPFWATVGMRESYILAPMEGGGGAASIFI